MSGKSKASHRVRPCPVVVCSSKSFSSSLWLFTEEHWNSLECDVSECARRENEHFLNSFTARELIPIKGWKKFKSSSSTNVKTGEKNAGKKVFFFSCYICLWLFSFSLFSLIGFSVFFLCFFIFLFVFLKFVLSITNHKIRF